MILHLNSSLVLDGSSLIKKPAVEIQCRIYGIQAILAKPIHALRGSNFTGTTLQLKNSCSYSSIRHTELCSTVCTGHLQNYCKYKHNINILCTLIVSLTESTRYLQNTCSLAQNILKLGETPPQIGLQPHPPPSLKTIALSHKNKKLATKCQCPTVSPRSLKS